MIAINKYPQYGYTDFVRVEDLGTVYNLTILNITEKLLTSGYSVHLGTNCEKIPNLLEFRKKGKSHTKKCL